MKWIQRAVLTGSIVIAQFLPGAVLAQTTDILGRTPASVPDGFSTLPKIIESVFNITIIVSGIIFVFLILLGGVQYLTSLGNEEGSTKARKIIINGAIGLVIVLTAYAIGNYVLQILGISGAVQENLNSPGTTSVF